MTTYELGELGCLEQGLEALTDMRSGASGVMATLAEL